MPFLSNIPALRLTLAYVLHEPSSLLPHSSIPTLLHLPDSVSSTLPYLPGTKARPTIRALVLDKDNTLCPPETALVHPAYVKKINSLKRSPEFANNSHSIVIVSNTAGSTPALHHEAEAKQLELELGLPVFRQQVGRKKPLCGPDLVKYFKEHGVTDNPAEIAVVGDRLATDTLLAKEMGSWSIFCSQGWRYPEVPERDYRGVLSRIEGGFARVMMERWGRRAPLPRQFMGSLP